MKNEICFCEHPEKRHRRSNERGYFVECCHCACESYAPNERGEIDVHEKMERERCTKCNAPFEAHHHRHYTKVGVFHSNCYQVTIKGMKPIDDAPSTPKTEEKELAEALIGMYEQYCDRGHLFMSAGEGASGVLEKYGYATFDEAGRLLSQRNIE